MSLCSLHKQAKVHSSSYRRKEGISAMVGKLDLLLVALAVALLVNFLFSDADDEQKEKECLCRPRNPFRQKLVEVFLAPLLFNIGSFRFTSQGWNFQRTHKKWPIILCVICPTSKKLTDHTRQKERKKTNCSSTLCYIFIQLHKTCFILFLLFWLNVRLC